MTAPKLAVTAADGYRVYKHPKTKETVPSVTTVLKVVNKPALIPWAAKMAAEYADENWARLSDTDPEIRIREIKSAYKDYAEDAAKTGDLVHTLIDCWQQGRPYPTETITDPFANSFIAFMSAKKPKFTENEVTLWSRQFGYAGTADWIAWIDGKLLLGDTKTGRGLYPETGMQVAALAGADFILRPNGTEEALPDLNGVAALHIRPRSWKLVEIQHQEDCFSAFIAARVLLEWQQNTAPKILGVNSFGGR